MKRILKWKYFISIMGMLLVLSGCYGEKADVEQKLEVKVKDKEVLSAVVNTDYENHLSEEDFIEFFKAYFSFSNEEIMVLNEKRSLSETAYWDWLNDKYSPLLQEKIGEYLQDELREKIKYEEREEDICLPKWMLINDYMVSGNAEVEAVKVISMNQEDEYSTYNVKVTTINACYPVKTFASQYIWDSKINYFKEKKEPDEEKNSFLQQLGLEDLDVQDYLYSEEEDAVRLQQSFTLTVCNEKPLKICCIKTSSPWKVTAESEPSFLNTQYILRLPYDEEADIDTVKLLKSLAEVLVEKERQDYKYYEKTYEAGREMFCKMWEEWGMEDKVKVPDEAYDVAFPGSISPYDHQVKSVRCSKDEIDITASLYGTKNQKCFILSIPVEALLYSNQIVYYSYKYFVGIEKNKVEFIQFMSINEIKEL